jgi:hypothetical protein
MPIHDDSIRHIIDAATTAGAHYDDEHGIWKNASGTITDEKAIVIRVDSVEQLQTIIEAINTENNASDENNFKIRTPQGQFDAFGYLTEECCLSMGCPSIFQRTAGFLGSINPLDASKIELKSYSQGPQVSHDFVVEFTDKFIKHQRVQLSVGVDGAPDTASVTPLMTWNDVIRKLAKSGKTLESSPTNTARSVIGTMVNGVDGLQKLVRKIDYLDKEGVSQTLDRGTDPDFSHKIVKGRFLGTITKMDVDTITDFNVEQHVKWAKTFEELDPAAVKKYFTQHDMAKMTFTPTYRDNPVSSHLPVNNIQITFADSTVKSKKNTKKNVVWEEVLEYVTDKAFKHGKKELSDVLYKTMRHNLIPSFQQIIAAINYTKRGEDSIVDKASNFLRLKTKHASNLLQTGFYVPVDAKDVGTFIKDIGLFMNDQLNFRFESSDEAPVSAVNIRPVSATEGGLSTTIAAPGQVLLSINVLSNPHSNGINYFLDQLNSFLERQGLSSTFDLSRLVPEGKPYFSGREENAQKFKNILEVLTPEGIGTSPFMPKEYLTLLNDATKSSENRTSGAHIPMPAIPEGTPEIGDPDQMIQMLKWLIKGVDQAIKHYGTDSHTDLKEVWTTFHVLALAAIKEFELYKERKDNPVWERKTLASDNEGEFNRERANSFSGSMI